MALSMNEDTNYFRNSERFWSTIDIYRSSHILLGSVGIRYKFPHFAWFFNRLLIDTKKFYLRYNL